MTAPDLFRPGLMPAQPANVDRDTLLALLQAAVFAAEHMPDDETRRRIQDTLDYARTSGIATWIGLGPCDEDPAWKHDAWRCYRAQRCARCFADLTTGCK